MPCALVSASYRVLLDAALARLPMGTFQFSVAGDEVQLGKPHPEPYERACRALGVDARQCVVFEDSEPGARAGNAAGAVVIAVPNRVRISAAPRRTHVASLAELNADRVVACWSGPMPRFRTRLLVRLPSRSLRCSAVGPPAQGRRRPPPRPGPRRGRSPC